jgi:predicted Zn-dependent protease
MRPSRRSLRTASAVSSSRRASSRVRPGVEALEDRLVLYSVSGNAWPSPQLITISFMPDGTSLGGGYSSNLSSALAADPDTAGQWQAQILRAAQTWAQQTNVNFAVVPDDGAPVGTESYQQGDPGFGDIRIGGFDYGSSTLASTIDPPPGDNYSDAGDILFNSDYAFSINGNGWGPDLFTVALHEFGHALGMDHSSYPSAVMYRYISGIKGLSSDDIAGVRSIYSGGGARSADSYNSGGSSNGSFASAADISSMVGASTLSATVPGLDITTAGQVEDFVVTAPAGVTGPLTVSVRSAGLSLLAPKLTVYASDHTTVLGSADGTGQYGATISATLASVTAGQQYYIKVQGADTSAFGTGRYALSVNFASPPSPATASSIDDQTTGYSETGTWTSAGGGGVNSEYRFAAASGSPTATATWTTTGLASGTYDVQVTWVPYSNRADDAHYWIYDGSTAVKEIRLNQQVAPSGPSSGGVTYQDLGPVSISSGTLKVVLSNDADGYVIADAARVLATAPPSGVVDDSQAGFSGTGTWTTAGGGGVDSEYVFAAATTSSTPTATATWTTTGLASGTYDVQVTWVPYPNRADNAPFSIYDGTTLLKTVLVNQQASPSGPSYGGATYLDLGAVTVSSGTLSVVLGNNADGYVIADAVRAVPTPTPPVPIDDLEAGYTEAGTWTGAGSGGANGEYRFAASGTGSATATWSYTNLTPGTYDVQVSWSANANRADDAPYSIYDGTTLIKTVLVNQQVAPVGTAYGGVTYLDLGTVTISGGTLKIVLSNDADGYVIADATRIVPSIALPNTALLDGYPISSGGSDDAEPMPGTGGRLFSPGAATRGPLGASDDPGPATTGPSSSSAGTGQASSSPATTDAVSIDPGTNRVNQTVPKGPWASGSIFGF